MSRYMMPFLPHSETVQWTAQDSWAVLFWLCLAVFFYTYAGYPILLWVISRSRKTKQLPPSSQPFLTLLIAAHNEGGSIGKKLEESLALNYPKERLQILVVSDGSVDDTVKVVQSYASRGVDLLVIPQQGGKTNAQNVAVAHATGEIIVFSDATTEYHPDSLLYIAGDFADKKVGAVSGRYSYQDLKTISSTGAGAKAYAGYDNRLREMQSATGSITGCCGCMYAVRRHLYTPLETHIISDLVEPLHVLLQGSKVIFEPRAVACEAVTHGSSKEFSMRVRVIARALTGLISVKELFFPWKHPWIALQLTSHKLLRYCVPLFLIGIFLSSLMLRSLPLYGIALAAQILISVLALLGGSVAPLRKLKPFSLPLYFFIVNTAALFGIFQFLRGRRYVTWRPQREPSHAN